MRITARESLDRREFYTVLIDGRDVTNVATFADDESGEVGVYPHRVSDSGVTSIDAEEVCRRDRAGEPEHDVLRGKVEIRSR